MLVRNHSVFLFLLIAATAQADTTDDPVGHYVSTTEIYQSDTLFQVSADINEDGFQDLLISSTNRDRQEPKGVLLWDYYLSNRGENYFVTAKGGQTLIPIQKFGVSMGRVESIGNKMALLSTQSGGGNSGVTTAYYFEGNVLKHKKIGDVQFQRRIVDDSGTDSWSDLRVTQIAQYETLTMNLEESLSSDVFQSLPAERTPGFFDLHYMIKNPDDRTSRLVYDRATEALVGTYKHGEFTPLEATAVKNAIESSDEGRPTNDSLTQNDSKAELADDNSDRNVTGVQTQKFDILWAALIIFGLLVLGAFFIRNKASRAR